MSSPSFYVTLARKRKQKSRCPVHPSAPAFAKRNPRIFQNKARPPFPDGPWLTDTADHGSAWSFLAARERAQGHGFHIDTDADPLFERMADKLLEAAQVRALLRFKPQDHFILASFFGKRYHVFAAHAFHALQQDIDLAWVNVDPITLTTSSVRQESGRGADTSSRRRIFPGAGGTYRACGNAAAGAPSLRSVVMAISPYAPSGTFSPVSGSIISKYRKSSK